ncbi:fungal-specific transcription factor domain-containing protein [Scheffersomyces coipomensis]|uniref:fungal-specific transcription factor domain-containing protein n=1 Tax=Scheffersomyces coipomensis TaxID=1788519 RepID=UPI00315DEBD2
MPPAKSEGSSQPAPNGSNDNKSVGDTNSTNSSSAGPAIVKQKITKSRNGCLTCKKKRLKCDETKPACLNCQKKNIECGGYATNFKWRSFNDAEEDKSSKDSFRKHLELASISMTGKSMKDIKIENDLISKGLNPQSYKRKSITNLTEREVWNKPTNAKLKRSGSDSRRKSEDENNSQRSYSINSSGIPPEVFTIREDAKVNRLESLADVAVDEIKRSPSVVSKEIYTRGNNNLSPFNQIPFSPNFTDFMRHEDNKTKEEFDINLTPSLSAIINFAVNMDESGTPFSLPQQTPVPDSGPSHRSLMKTSEQEQIIHLYSQYTCSIMSIKNGAHENPWRSMIVPLASKYNCLFNSIACMTLFHLAGSSQFSDTIGDLRAKGYMYMKRCILELASGLSRMNSNGDSESVYELPADIALTTCLNLAVSESWDTHITSGIAHLKGAKSMIQKVLTLLRDQQQMIHTKKPTSKKIEMDSPNGETTDFAHSELIKSKRIDLKRKLVLVEEAEWDSMFNEKSDFSKMFDKGTTNNSIPIPKSLQFLFNIWIYFEVLAQMTTDTNYDDKGIDLVATITTMLQSAQKQRDEEKSNQLQHIANAAANANETRINDARFNFFDNFETFSYNTDYIDPLLGCGQSLFSIMGKVANLIAKIRKIKRNEKWKGNGRNSLTTITLATELKRQLIEWKPTITAEMINQAGMYEDNTNRSMWDIPSCIATAEAYRFATLLYLHQAVPEIPSSGSHQLAEKIFILLASIPTNSDLHTILIFPLLVSSCEAEAGEEREWCEDRWSLLSQKLWIGNIDRAFEVVKEVWKRKNEYIQKMKSDVRNNSGNNAGGSGSGRSKGNEDEELRNISVQISGLMAVINNDQNATPIDDIKGGITSRLHWSTVMKEWGWEVLLG